MLKRVMNISIILFFISCNQKIEGVIVDKITMLPIDSVAVLERDPKDSYPHYHTFSDKHGKFSFLKSNRNSILYFSKNGYEDLRVKFNGIPLIPKIGDTIYLSRK